MMEHFGGNAKGVGGNWTSGTNLKHINEVTAAGKSIEHAIPGTWTAKSAARYGFTEPKIVEIPQGSPGNYTRVNVIFERPK